MASAKKDESFGMAQPDPRKSVGGPEEDCAQEMPSQFNRSGNYFCKEELENIPKSGCAKLIDSYSNRL